MNRRGFLGSIIAMAAAPAIVKASSLMPGKVWTPATFKVTESFGVGAVDSRVLKTGWMAWNAGFISEVGLWSPEKSLRFIAEHNSFVDKPYRLSFEQAERDCVEDGYAIKLENYMKP